MRPLLARAYERIGQPDSAITKYEEYLRSPAFDRLFTDAAYLASTYRRLGELYAERGRTREAAGMLAKFVVLWRNADPALQSDVREVEGRLASLTSDSPARRPLVR